MKQCSKECICKGIHLIIPHFFLTAEFVTSLSPCNLFIYLLSFFVFLFFYNKVGYDAGDQFSFHWWDHVFNKTAKSIVVQESNVSTWHRVI